MQKKYRFQIVDLLILLLMCALLFGFVYYFILQNDLSGAPPSVTYTLTFEGLPTQVAEKVTLNDIIYDAASGLAIGTVKKIDLLPTKYSVLNGDTVLEVPYPNQTTLVLTLSANAVHTDPLAANGTILRIGKNYSVQSVHFTGEGVCTALTQNQT